MPSLFKSAAPSYTVGGVCAGAEAGTAFCGTSLRSPLFSGVGVFTANAYSSFFSEGTGAIANEAVAALSLEGTGTCAGAFPDFSSVIDSLTADVAVTSTVSSSFVLLMDSISRSCNSFFGPLVERFRFLSSF